MDSQAGRIYESIRDLLDLKQKHANAFEARYAREQATGTQRQGQTIMVFTIGEYVLAHQRATRLLTMITVTVIFLPLSFVAAFFAIKYVRPTVKRKLRLLYCSLLWQFTTFPHLRLILTHNLQA